MIHLSPQESEPEIYRLARELVTVCKKQGVCLTGFVFSLKSETPFLMYIGTVRETGPDLTALHLTLCDMCDDQDKHPHVTEPV